MALSLPHFFISHNISLSTRRSIFESACVLVTLSELNDFYIFDFWFSQIWLLIFTQLTYDFYIIRLKFLQYDFWFKHIWLLTSIYSTFDFYNLTFDLNIYDFDFYIFDFWLLQYDFWFKHIWLLTSTYSTFDFYNMTFDLNIYDFWLLHIRLFIFTYLTFAFLHGLHLDVNLDLFRCPLIVSLVIFVVSDTHGEIHL